VTNNQIGLDENGQGSLGTLQLNRNGNNNGGNQNNDILSVYSSQSGTGNGNITCYDNDTSNQICQVNPSGTVDNSFSPYDAGVISEKVLGTELIQSEGGSRVGNGVDNTYGLQFDTPNGANNVIVNTRLVAPVTVDLTKYLPLVIDGVTYKLIIGV